MLPERPKYLRQIGYMYVCSGQRRVMNRKLNTGPTVNTQKDAHTQTHVQTPSSRKTI
jgi:hypothetical protein